MPPECPKPLDWIGGSKRDYLRFPDAVQDEIGYALHVAQMGERHRSAKLFRGFGGAGVLELVEDHDGDTYQAVYTVRYSEVVYVLHGFQKKSKQGITTPKQEIDLIKQRLRRAEGDYQARNLADGAGRSQGSKERDDG